MATTTDKKKSIYDTDFNAPTIIDGADITIAENVTAHVAFNGSTAGYHDSVGMYTYDARGNVTSVQMLFDNVSGQGVQNGPSKFDINLHAGQHVGFFVAPNAYALGNNAALFDSSGGKFILIDATNGVSANVDTGHAMQLAYLAKDGQETVVQTQFGTLFTTNRNDNADGFQHSHVSVDVATGQLSVAFEDMWGGGNADYHDANFTMSIGRDNAGALAQLFDFGSSVSSHSASVCDTIAKSTWVTQWQVTPEPAACTVAHASPAASPGIAALQDLSLHLAVDAFDR